MALKTSGQLYVLHFSPLFIGMYVSTPPCRNCYGVTQIFQSPLHRDVRFNGTFSEATPFMVKDFSPLFIGMYVSTFPDQVSAKAAAVLFQSPLHRDVRFNRYVTFPQSDGIKISVPSSSGCTFQQTQDSAPKFQETKFQSPLHRDVRFNFDCYQGRRRDFLYFSPLFIGMYVSTVIQKTQSRRNVSISVPSSSGCTFQHLGRAPHQFHVYISVPSSSGCTFQRKS